MKSINNGQAIDPERGYTRIDHWNDKTTGELTRHYREILENIGEDTGREGIRTPMKHSARQFLRRITMKW